MSTELVPLDTGPLLDSFLAGRTPTTLRAYRQDLEDFRRYVNAPSASAAVERLLGGGQGEAHRLAIGYRAWMRERSLSPATINRRLAALRSLAKLARVVGALSWSLAVPNLRTESYRDTRGPGLESVQKLLARTAMDRSARGRRDCALLHLLFDLGLRRGEVAALDIDDLDLARASLAVTGKGRLEKNQLSLPDPTIDALALWLGVRGTKPGPLFASFDPAAKGDGRLDASSIYRTVRARSAAAGFRAAPHGLRHTAITEACKAAAAAGIGLEEVLDFSRHRSVAVLMVYRDRERNVQSALADLVARAGGE